MGNDNQLLQFPKANNSHLLETGFAGDYQENVSYRDSDEFSGQNVKDVILDLKEDIKKIEKKL